MSIKTSWQNDNILQSIIHELQTTHHCHTIILYGSRARGDFSKTSDYDVAGITAFGDKKWIARFDEEHQVFHDIFILPELETLRHMASLPESLAADELASRKVWYRKMLARAEVQDIEGKYRHIWVIFAILEDYFSFKQLRYQGPKKAFQYLAQHDRTILALFDNALSNNQNVTDLKRLIEAIL
jgi:predicted nucleotidyltransferase